ncbi:hypothetical protein AB0L57_05305 [Nocardia sp. NPDC052254]|uniref:hypothetical protein n=1 Tax=Nocardia sp. NPDC052254 TaxID=3155681 RepID=UPI00344397E4
MGTGFGQNGGGFEPDDAPDDRRDCAPPAGFPEAAPTEAIPRTPEGVTKPPASQATPWSRPDPAAAHGGPAGFAPPGPGVSPPGGGFGVPEPGTTSPGGAAHGPGFGGTDAPTTAFGWVGQAPGPEPAPAPNFGPQYAFPPVPGPGAQPGAPQEHSGWNQAQHPATAQFQPPAQPPPGRPPRRRKVLLLSGIGVVVVIAIGVTVAIIASRNPEGSTTAKSGTPSMVSALSSENRLPPPQSPPAAPSSQPAPEPRPVPAVPPGEAPPPTILGYQVVQILDRGAAYDAPAGWKPAEVTTAVWGSGSDTIEVAGLTQDGKNYCPNYTRTNAFLTLSQQPDPAAAAADIGKRIGAFGWTDARVGTPGAAEPMVSADGQLHGAFVETTGSAPAPAPGCATTFTVYTFAFPSENGNFVMTIAADTGVDQSVDKATAKRILSTIRPLPAR